MSEHDGKGSGAPSTPERIVTPYPHHTKRKALVRLASSWDRITMNRYFNIDRAQRWGSRERAESHDDLCRYALPPTGPDQAAARAVILVPMKTTRIPMTRTAKKAPATAPRELW